MNPELLEAVSCDRLHHDLFYLCRDPLPFRTVSYTLPWHTKNSLDEADDFIAAEMRKFSDRVTLIPYKLKPFRCNSSKPLHHWYSTPLPEDPWYDANCIEVTLPGTKHPDEIIQLVSHKDSMSWINSPGAHDNAVGAVANMELIRVLSRLKLDRTVRVLFCNEEHWPWYSKDYAENAKLRGDNIIAVLNQDSLCGKSDSAAASQLRTFASVYSSHEGRALAEFLRQECEKYQLPLTVTIAPKTSMKANGALPAPHDRDVKFLVNDDDGSFIKAGYLRTVMNLGSYPYGDPQYHLAGDTPERVDIINLELSVKLLMAVILDIDAGGGRVFEVL
jgi:hypothetical protein